MPATVQTILAARIDRLPAEEKQLLAGRVGDRQRRALRAPGGDRGAAGGGPAAGARAPAGGGVPLRDAASSRTWSTPSSTRSPTTWPTRASWGSAGAIFTPRWRPPSSACTPIASSSTWSGWRTTRGRARSGTRRCATCARPAPRSSCARPTARRPPASSRRSTRSGGLPETPDAIAESLDIRFDLRTALIPLGEGNGWGPSSTRPKPSRRPSATSAASAAR